MRNEMALDPAYQTCMRQEAFHDHICEADPLTRRLLEWEHAFIHGGKQINEPWAIISICWNVHRGTELNKEKNQFIALMRATVEDLEKYQRTDWVQLFNYLAGKYYFFTNIEGGHGPEAEHEDCWMCDIIDEML